MPTRRTSLAVTLARLAIKIYRNLLSNCMLQSCRFVPSCSVYAEGCLHKYGFLRSLRLIVWRLLRCHPFAQGGIDQVPGFPHRRITTASVASSSCAAVISHNELRRGPILADQRR